MGIKLTEADRLARCRSIIVFNDKT